VDARTGARGEKMNIEFKEIHDFSEQELKDLFLSVEWSSGHYPEKLVIAMKNFKTVISAWDDNKLVGMICAMDDGIMNSYIHYLLVRPEYQGNGIGKTLVKKAKKKYKNFLRIVLVAYNKEIAFYEKCGFKKSDDSSAMFITELWT
jgi:ribosomal protein S18 acetylase RimI-like enzyme